MKTSAILTLIVTILFQPLFAQNDTIYATVNGDTATIWHIGTFWNCTSVFDMDVQIDKYQITVTEYVYEGIVHCLCYFDLSVTIANLEAGYYSVDVYSIEPYNNWNTIYWGSTSFIILEPGQGTPLLVSQYHSDCNDCPPPENLQAEVECYDLNLYWEVPQQSTVIGFNIYRNGTQINTSIFGGTSYSEPLAAGTYEFCVTSVCLDGESEPVCVTVEIPYGDPPENFSIASAMGGALLTWESPDGFVKDFLGYHIFRDFELLVPNTITDTFYLDQTVQINNLYQYYITAVYENCESETADTLEFNIVGSGMAELEKKEIKIFPNPAADRLYIETPYTKNLIRIIDLLGTIVFKGTIEEIKTGIDISDINPGIYFIKVESSNSSVVKKFIIKH